MTKLTQEQKSVISDYIKKYKLAEGSDEKRILSDFSQFLTNVIK